MAWNARDDFAFEPEVPYLNDIDYAQTESLFSNPGSFDSHLYDNKFSNISDILDLDISPNNNSPTNTPKRKDNSSTNQHTQNSCSIDTNSPEQLMAENTRLRQYVITLQKRVEEVTLQNQKLKNQLNAWRDGFSQAMLNGIHKN